MDQVLRMKSCIVLCVRIQFSKHGWLRNIAVVTKFLYQLVMLTILKQNTHVNHGNLEYEQSLVPLMTIGSREQQEFTSGC